MNDDLSTLAWVVDEVRRSLETAHKALRRYLREAEASGGADLANVDPSVLRTARAHLHQSVGALELVGLGLAALPLRAAEAALQRMSARPELITPAAVQTIEKGSFALLDFLSRKLAGKPVTALSMFPQYRALQELAGAARAHPADLWWHDWQWRASPGDPRARPRASDASAVGEFEVEMLGVMRGGGGGSFARLSQLCADLGAGSSGNLATLWQLASAFLQALADDLLEFDVHAKRVASRLLAQLRAGALGQASDRLAQDLLFFCARAMPSAARPAGDRLAAARLAHGLDSQRPNDYDSSSLGLFDPAQLAQARKRVVAAKEVWSEVAAGELARLPGLVESFALVGDSLTRIYPNGQALAQALQALAAQCQAAASEPPAALAMEVATSLLFIEASLQDAEFDHPQMPERVRRLAQRLDDVHQGRDPGALELWMEQLYRQVSDRQTMGNVVQELRTALSEVEKQIDQYFRNPAQREVLIPVPSQLSAMRGVLSLLDMDHASQAVLRMRDDVDALASTEVDPQQAIQAGTFDRLADNLGALSFLIDMVSVQPHMAKSLFHFDAATGQLKAAMVRAERPSSFGALEALGSEQPTLVEQAQTIALAAAHPQADVHALGRELEQLTQQARAADQHGLADVASRAQSTLAKAGGADDVERVRRQLAASIQEFVSTQEAPLAESAAPLRPVPPPGPPVAPGQTGLEDDAEMREIFLEEAREVTDSARRGLADLAERPDDLAAMTLLRRAFHTLKGSSRMLGLRDFGDAAWACEQLYNARMADSIPADANLRGFTLEVLAHFERWVDAIEAGDASDFHSDRVIRSAEALRLERRWLPLAAATASLRALVPDLPSAADLELSSAALLPLPEVELVDAAEFDLVLELPDTPLVGAALPEGLVALDPDRLHVPPRAPVRGTAPDEVAFELDFGAIWSPAGAQDEPADLLPASDIVVAPQPAPQPALEPALEPTFELAFDLAMEPSLDPAAPATVHDQALLADAEDEPFKLIGDLRVGIPLFNIYLNEADELSRRLSTEMAEWAHELNRPAGEVPVGLAHSLAGNSAAVGFAALSQLARAMEHALMRSNSRVRGRGDDAALFAQAADEVRRLLHQFAAGFLRSPDAVLMQRLADLEHAPAETLIEAPETLGAGAEAEPEAEAEISAAGLEPARPEAPAVAVEEVFAQLGQPALMPFAALPPAAVWPAGAHAEPLGLDDDIDAVDAIDGELFEIFHEEAAELIPQLQSRLRGWAQRPDDGDAAAACMRTLHTLKGSARLAGAMRLGELAHRIESAVEALHARGHATAAEIDGIVVHGDTFESAYETLRRGEAEQPPAQPAPSLAAPALVEFEAMAAAALRPVPSVPQVRITPAGTDQPLPGSTPVSPLAPAESISWAQFTAPASRDVGGQPRAVTASASSVAAVRVRAPLLDRLVNHSGELSITRSRLHADVGMMKTALGDLSENLERLRRQLRDIELQAETQIDTRLEAARAAAQVFDPLEMDRFTRFQELTRMMAESVSDVATVQRGLQRTLQSAEDGVVHQARLTRNLQDDLLRTRMVEFDGLSERLYRVVRQAAKETGKQVRLDLSGGSIEVDRGVLDRMTGAFEHLLRNCVVHGIELPAQRVAMGKDATGSIVVAATQEGNEMAVEFRDDGAGLGLSRIRAKAIAVGLLSAQAQPTEAELAALIFQPGFSTAEQVTGLAGRGVGMDVVRADVNAMGGRIETATSAGQGTSFRLVLPLTTAVTQVVMMRCGSLITAVPSALVELVKRVPAAELPGLYRHGVYLHAETELPFYWLAALLQGTAYGSTLGRTATLVVIRSAAQRIAVHVDEVIGNQEVVVKNLGPQLSRLPGLAGMTLLPSGKPALIYNPVALATLYGQAARGATLAALAASSHAAQRGDSLAAVAVQMPLVLVVDDSITVRRVTQRLLVREGYRVVLAKDGLEALERLADERPLLVITDIEMPRMDGFDLVRNLRNVARLADLPVIMITSRIAQRHRDHAAELGVRHYLGKPYVEEDLVALVARYVGKLATV